MAVNYVLITPTKNEESFIGETLASVIRQSVRPVEWVIVSDGSTDGTEALVRDAAQRQPWIRLVTLPAREKRDFGSVVRATEAGVEALRCREYRFLGLLDSDVRFATDYFERVLQAFATCPRLGLAGGMVVDCGHRTDRPPHNRIDVPGAAQFFSRECFDAVRPLQALPEGGWDTVTCVRARMLGYETRLLTDLVVDHLKPRNSGEGGFWRRHWQLGVRDYALGYHPLFEAFKIVSRLTEPPAGWGAFARFVGFVGASLRRRPRLLPDDLLAFIRQEQLSRLRNLRPRHPAPGVRPSAVPLP